MKKLLFILFLTISGLAVADTGDFIRKNLNISEKDENSPNKDLRQIPVELGDGNSIPLTLYFSDSHTDSAILVFEIRKSKSEIDHFTAMTFVVKWFLKNYKIESVHKKNITFWHLNDKDKYSFMYKLSTNNFKLLNNRDFGVKDFTSFNENGGLVYPLKVILRKGKFININGSQADENIKKRYSKFLTTFDISPLIEGAVEGMYEKKKMK